MNIKYSIYGRFYNIVIKRNPAFFSDTLVIKIMFYIKFRKELNLKGPVSFNEKINWLKLYDNNPLKGICSDKYLVRDYVEKKIGSHFLIPLIGVWDKPEDIDFESLPNKFVLKANHASGTNIICTSKLKLDISYTIDTLNEFLKLDYYLIGRERQYKNIKRKIICEAFIGEINEVPKDYKFFCLNGEIKFIQLDLNRFSNLQRILYSKEWNRLPIKWSGYDNTPDVTKPDKLGEMLAICKKLSADFSFVRIDLYSSNNQIYFGELTFTPWNGLKDFEPESFDIELGKQLKISNCK
jgi:hypothetical protein